LDEEKINNLKPGTILINSSRGPVVDNTALLKRLKDKNDITVVLDVWENEPSINQELLQKIYIGTQHIAGYSYEGKVNGTVMIYESLCEFLGEEKSWQPELKQIDDNKISLTKEETENFLYSITNKIYPIEQDSQKLKSYAELNSFEFAKQFDLLRKNYKLRREFNNYFIEPDNLDSSQIATLEKLRLNIL
jgi:erythronate-4-phosphate dehydrogenase